MKNAFFIVLLSAASMAHGTEKDQIEKNINELNALVCNAEGRLAVAVAESRDAGVAFSDVIVTDMKNPEATSKHNKFVASIYKSRLSPADQYLLTYDNCIKEATERYQTPEELK